LYAIESLDAAAIFQIELYSCRERFRPRASGWLWPALGAPLAILPNQVLLNRRAIALFRWAALLPFFQIELGQTSFSAGLHQTTVRVPSSAQLG
jgi:hypothetical protein